MLKVPVVKWSRKWIFVARSVFSGIPMFLGNCHFQCKFEIIGQAKKGLSVQKSPILRPLYNRYFCQITIIKWSRIHQNSTRKCFFGDIFSKYPFSIIFPIIAARALRQGEGRVKNGFQSDFLGPYDIPHGYKCQAKKILDLKFLCTTIMIYA